MVVVSGVVVLPGVVVEMLLWVWKGVLEVLCVGVEGDEPVVVDSGVGVLPGVVDSVSITGVLVLPGVGVEGDEPVVVDCGVGVLPGVVLSS